MKGWNVWLAWLAWLALSIILNKINNLSWLAGGWQAANIGTMVGTYGWQMGWQIEKRYYSYKKMVVSLVENRYAKKVTLGNDYFF